MGSPKIVATFMLINNITTLVTRPGSGDGPRTEEECRSKYKHFATSVLLNVHPYCDTAFDQFLCWPPTEPGTTIQQRCPASVRLSDPNRYATRRCREDAFWETRHSHKVNDTGWTNFTNCFPPDIQNIFVEGFNDNDNSLTKYTIAERSRYIEITGYIISCIAVTMALFIFQKFRIIQNIRNLIHKHVFYSILFETILHLIIFFDQAITRNSIAVKTTSYRLKGIDNTPTICECLYVMAEYSVTAAYSWIFIEGLHLNYLISKKALQPFNFGVYCFYGWTVPLILTATWTIIVWLSYNKESVKKCWFGYNLKMSYWILQGPRAAVILCNAVILVRVLNMVIKKLKDAQTPDNLKIKKSVKAALFLLPILGLSNVLSTFDISIYSNIYVFMVFCYTRQFIKSFQGFLLTLIYCVGNEEVRAVVLRRVRRFFTVNIEWSSLIRRLLPRQEVINPVLATVPQENANNTNASPLIEASTEIPLALISYAEGLSMDPDVNRSGTRRRHTFWRSFSGLFCFKQWTNNDLRNSDFNEGDEFNNSETDVLQTVQPRRRHVIGPNLPTFLNCLQRERVLQRQKHDDFAAFAKRQRLAQRKERDDSARIAVTRETQNKTTSEDEAGPSEIKGILHQSKKNIVNNKAGRSEKSYVGLTIAEVHHENTSTNQRGVLRQSKKNIVNNKAGRSDKRVTREIQNKTTSEDEAGPSEIKLKQREKQNANIEDETAPRPLKGILRQSEKNIVNNKRGRSDKGKMVQPLGVHRVTFAAILTQVMEFTDDEDCSNGRDNDVNETRRIKMSVSERNRILASRRARLMNMRRRNPPRIIYTPATSSDSSEDSE